MFTMIPFCYGQSKFNTITRIIPEDNIPVYVAVPEVVSSPRAILNTPFISQCLYVYFIMYVLFVLFHTDSKMQLCLPQLGTAVSIVSDENWLLGLVRIF